MKIRGIFIAALIVACGITAGNAQTPAEPGTCQSGFADSKTVIQTNYNEMYQALPQDLKDRILGAAITIENLRMKTPADLQNYVTTERAKAEDFIKTTISQMAVSDMLKAQVDDARKDVNVQINDRMNELKARRAAHR
ncbi:MAG TPA: hypothetical protein VLX68_11035 [Chitinivibrionales bacterium]|nr:hypothetical protein [Chitinivibrionales bacterium]